MMAKSDFDFAFDTSGIDKLLAQHPRNTGLFMDAVAETTVGNMTDSFDTSPPGRSYKRGKKRVHVASMPGHPPNIDHSDLVNSLRWERRGSDAREIHGAAHGLYLEDSAELNRPFIGPAVQETNKDVPSLGKRWLFE
jgi:hypothetical protein